MKRQLTLILFLVLLSTFLFGQSSIGLTGNMVELYHINSMGTSGKFNWGSQAMNGLSVEYASQKHIHRLAYRFLDQTPRLNPKLILFDAPCLARYKGSDWGYEYLHQVPKLRFLYAGIGMYYAKARMSGNCISLLTEKSYSAICPSMVLEANIEVGPQLYLSPSANVLFRFKRSGWGLPYQANITPFRLGLKKEFKLKPR